MPLRSNDSVLRLPRGWRKITRAGVLHARGVRESPRTTTGAANACSAALAVVQDVRLHDCSSTNAFNVFRMKRVVPGIPGKLR